MVGGAGKLNKKMTYFDYFVMEQQLIKEISFNGYYDKILFILLITAILCGARDFTDLYREFVRTQP